MGCIKKNCLNSSNIYEIVYLIFVVESKRMTRSSRFISEKQGRSKSYKSQHSRKFRRRLDNDVKRAKRRAGKKMCTEQIHTKFKHKNSIYTSSSTKAISKSKAHHIHGKSKYPYYCNPFDRFDLEMPHKGHTVTTCGIPNGECPFPTEDITSFCDTSGRKSFTWDYDNHEYNIDIAPFRKIKALWDSLDVSLKIKSFEDIGNDKCFYDYITRLSSDGATIYQFAMACVYYTQHYNCVGAEIDVAIKRLKRRGHTNKFISNRTHTQKYAY